MLKTPLAGETACPTPLQFVDLAFVAQAVLPAPVIARVFAAAY
jgi:hypothetical protein